jgi:glutamyl-tRNA synthetase
MSGRFAPSPTGDLHLGNLRTAALAWLAARAHDLDFIVRMEDLDRVQASREHERAQLADLAALGIESDVEVIRQSERFERYNAAIDTLAAQGLVYECFCSRREVRAEIEAAPSAPHLPPGAYPGTCRELTDAKRRRFLDAGRNPALRLRAPDDGHIVEFDDLVTGRFSGGIDDTVLRRNDGVPSYNVAVIVDDAAQGVTQVVRGDDLLDSTPRQIHLHHLLQLPVPTYAHVPLVVGDDGERLSKRHGSVSIADLTTRGIGVADVLDWILSTLGSAMPTSVAPRTLTDAAERFDLKAVASPPLVAPTWIAG